MCVLAGLACGRGPAPRPPEDRPLFSFHSNFWVNLHHRLHHAATARRPASGGAPVQPESPGWRAAVAAYQERYGAKGAMGIILDEDQHALRARLSTVGPSAEIPDVEPPLPPELVAAAELARPEWDAQDRANRAWIAAVQPLLRQHGAELRTALVAVMGAPWPDRPIHVDVSGFAGPFGAYTIDDPALITISSNDPGYAGEAALEMLFHEAAHLLIGPIERKLEAEARRTGRVTPDALWHALIFYTCGELAKRRLGVSYVPYATKNGLWQRGWVELEVALGRHWGPYLEGRATVDQAVAGLIAELGRPVDEGQSKP